MGSMELGHSDTFFFFFSWTDPAWWAKLQSTLFLLLDTAIFNTPQLKLAENFPNSMGMANFSVKSGVENTLSKKNAFLKTDDEVVRDTPQGTL